jgi:hypothetical protein
MRNEFLLEINNAYRKALREFKTLEGLDVTAMDRVKIRGI